MALNLQLNSFGTKYVFKARIGIPFLLKYLFKHKVIDCG